MNRTTTTAVTIGAAVGVIAVFVEGLLGVKVPPEVAAAETTLFTIVAGLVFPR